MKKARGSVVSIPAALRNLGVTANSTPVFKTIYSADASGADAEIWDPTAGKKFLICGMSVQCAAGATPLYLKDGAATFWSCYTQSWNDFSNCPYISTTAANKLYVRTTAAGATTVNVWGYVIG